MAMLRLPRIVGVVVAVYLLVVTAYFAFETGRRSTFIADAASTTGTVVSLQPRPLAGATRVHTIGDDVPRAPEVRYEVGGQSYLYTPTHALIGAAIQVGQQVEVLYDPANPARARLRDEGVWLLPMLTAGFATSAIAVLAVLVVTRRRGHGAADHPDAAH